MPHLKLLEINIGWSAANIDYQISLLKSLEINVRQKEASAYLILITMKACRSIGIIHSQVPHLQVPSINTKWKALEAMVY